MPAPSADASTKALRATGRPGASAHAQPQRRARAAATPCARIAATQRALSSVSVSRIAR